MKKIIWLASYPKSGNTWFRVFLTNLQRNAEAPAYINELESISIASARGLFDDATGLSASDLTVDEIDLLRPDFYFYLAEMAEESPVMKIHDAYTILKDTRPLIPAEVTGSAIYFIRNPLDVAVSFAHHKGWTCDMAVAKMADEKFSLCNRKDHLHLQLRQKLFTWSRHVLSWVDRAPFPVCLLRYEDMKRSPLSTFTRAVRFAGLAYTDEQIRKSLEFSTFDILQKQEETEGFREKSPASKRFFRKGEIGSWREELSEELARQVVHDHSQVMRRFGYLNENDEIVF